MFTEHLLHTRHFAKYQHYLVKINKDLAFKLSDKNQLLRQLEVNIYKQLLYRQKQKTKQNKTQNIKAKQKVKTKQKTGEKELT